MTYQLQVPKVLISHLHRRHVGGNRLKQIEINTDSGYLTMRRISYRTKRTYGIYIKDSFLKNAQYRNHIRHNFPRRRIWTQWPFGSIPVLGFQAYNTNIKVPKDSFLSKQGRNASFHQEFNLSLLNLGTLALTLK